MNIIIDPYTYPLNIPADKFLSLIERSCPCIIFFHLKKDERSKRITESVSEVSKSFPNVFCYRIDWESHQQYFQRVYNCRLYEVSVWRDTNRILYFSEPTFDELHSMFSFSLLRIIDLDSQTYIEILHENQVKTATQNKNTPIALLKQSVEMIGKEKPKISNMPSEKVLQSIVKQKKTQSVCYQLPQSPISNMQKSYQIESNINPVIRNNQKLLIPNISTNKYIRKKRNSISSETIITTTQVPNTNFSHKNLTRSSSMDNSRFQTPQIAPPRFHNSVHRYPVWNVPNYNQKVNIDVKHKSFESPTENNNRTLISQSRNPSFTQLNINNYLMQPDRKKVNRKHKIETTSGWVYSSNFYCQKNFDQESDRNEN